MQTHYIALAQNGTHELVIKKSRFICYLQRIQSETEALAVIDQIKKSERKANHHCHAYLLGDTDDIQHASDDGEPSGTAGVPMLDVLKRQHLHNTIAVTTRYFGGIKLGAGGLIRAYANSVAQGITALGLVQGELRQELTISLDYAQQGRFEYFLQQQNLAIVSTDYGVKINLTILVPKTELTTVQQKIIDFLAGQTQLKPGEQRYLETPYQPDNGTQKS